MVSVQIHNIFHIYFLFIDMCMYSAIIIFKLHQETNLTLNFNQVVKVYFKKTHIQSLCQV